MAIVVVTIDGQAIPFKIKNMNSIGFEDRLSRARFDINIFLSLIVYEPQLSATEWYEKIPELYKNKILEAIENHIYEGEYNV